MRHTNHNLRAVTCTKCGRTQGRSANIGQGGLRCNTCGRFAQSAVGFCAKHNVDWDRLSGYDHCPKCRQEREIEQARAEQSYVGHNMHPTVDARRR